MLQNELKSCFWLWFIFSTTLCRAFRILKPSMLVAGDRGHWWIKMMLYSFEPFVIVVLLSRGGGWCCYNWRWWKQSGIAQGGPPPTRHSSADVSIGMSIARERASRWPRCASKNWKANREIACFGLVWFHFKIKSNICNLIVPFETKWPALSLQRELLGWSGARLGSRRPPRKAIFSR